jgi:hypothetical protein
MKAPQTLDEYLDILDQAIYEAGEVLLCAGDEDDPDNYEFSSALPLYEQLDRKLKALHANILAGRHAFADGSDLSFMPLVRQWRNRIPFCDLLEALNLAHKSGL